MVVVGITPHIDSNGKYSLNPQYVEAIEAAGGMAVMLPYVAAHHVEAQLRIVSGIVLSGGGDVDPLLYGQEPAPETEPPSMARDAYELELCRRAVLGDVALLGICRGAQVMNVALGGDLVQHIDGHSFNTPRRGDYIHDIEVGEGSLLASITGGGPLSTNSIHHQAVGARLGKAVRVSAKAGDSTVEAIEVAGRRFALGVQWHPEELHHKDERQAAIFRAFVGACK